VIHFSSLLTCSYSWFQVVGSRPVCPRGVSLQEGIEGSLLDYCLELSSAPCTLHYRPWHWGICTLV
jgi:hypothetical protein